MKKYTNISFGGEMPKEIDYRKQADGFAEVWLYTNIREVEEDGFVADGVFFKTKLSEEEVLAQKGIYFAEEEPETTIDDLVEAIDILTNIILGGE